MIAHVETNIDEYKNGFIVDYVVNTGKGLQIKEQRFNNRIAAEQFLSMLLSAKNNHHNAINSGGYCAICNKQSIHYSILNGSFTYFCTRCGDFLDKDKVNLVKIKSNA